MKKRHLKILFSTTLVILLASAFYRYQSNHKTLNNSLRNSDWKTFNKVSLKDISSYPTTSAEKKDMNVDDKSIAKGEKQKTKRSMASTGVPDLKQRSWQGTGPRPLSSEIDNNYNPRWKEELGKNLLRFLRPNTKTIVKRETSALIKHKGQNLMVEHVLVKLKSPEGRHYGYNAYVDSSNGKIIHTWNRTIHEQFVRQALRLNAARLNN